MSAIPEEFIRKTAKLSEEVTRPFSNSKKIYVQGSRADIRVGMREVEQSATHTNNTPEYNPPVTIYDTSGPYTDPTAHIDLLKGLDALRETWILERNDTEQLAGPSSEFGIARHCDPKLAHLRFEHLRKPRRAKAGHNVSQMHYARKGIITPEMEYVAIRETLRLNELRKDPRYTKLLRQHRGEKLRREHSQRDHARIRARRNRPRPRHYPRQYQSPGTRTMIIGRNFLVKINTNIGNSAVSSSIEEEVEKMVWSARWGGEHADGSVHRQEHPRDA